MSLAASSSSNVQNFSQFFDSFLSLQSSDLHSLRSSLASGAAPAELTSLINQVISHYENYYQRKAEAASVDVLPMFTPSWTSSTENLFLWVGGWRPSMAIQLLYSKSGIQLEAHLEEIIRGEVVGDLGDISHQQLMRIDELRRSTVLEERRIEELDAVEQEKIADGEMVALSEVLSGIEGGEEEMDTAMGRKRRGITQVLREADELRLQTLKDLVAILSPVQAAHFLIAAAELHLRVHDYGKWKDAGGNAGPGVVVSG